MRLSSLLPLLLLPLSRSLDAQRAPPSSIEGTWEGVVTAGAIKRTLRLEFATDSGQARGTVDLPNQYALGYALANVAVKGDVVTFDFPQTLPNARFDLLRAGNRMLGSFESIQGRDTILGAVDLMRRRTAARPYRLEEVTFNNGNITLRGTLFLPASARSAPAVVFVHGSGPQTRESYLRFFADQFARAGFATLIYDKRNTGRTDIPIWLQGGGSFSELADDALVAVRLLRARPEIDTTRVGIWGLSQGAWIGALAASRDSGIAFAILISGGGVSPGEAELYDDEVKLREAGYSRATIDTAISLLRLADAYVRSGADSDWTKVETERSALRSRPWFPFLDRFPLSMPREAPVWRGLATDIDYDPSPALESLRIPVLLILGSADQLTPPHATETRVRAAFRRSGSPQLRVHIVPDADHGLFVPPRGANWLQQEPAKGWIPMMLVFARSVMSR